MKEVVRDPEEHLVLETGTKSPRTDARRRRELSSENCRRTWIQGSWIALSEYRGPHFYTCWM